MIYVCTVHFRSSAWIGLQRRYLRRFISEPFRYVGCLEGIADEFSSAFDEVVPAIGPHAGKLNLLASAVASQASPVDRIYFLDGDAFPIGDVVDVVESALDRAPLVAVRRDENARDPQPHPSFCATSVGFWREINGDWSEGFAWERGGKHHTDVGANLLYQLGLGSHPWVPLLRSNRWNLHPLWFGIYADVIYHHGAGFRHAMSGADREDFYRLMRRVPISSAPLERVAYVLWRAKRRRKNGSLSAMVREWIENDEEFYRVFTTPGASPPTAVAGRSFRAS